MSEKIPKKNLIIKSSSSIKSDKSLSDSSTMSSEKSTSNSSITESEKNVINEDMLKKEFSKINCNDENYYSSKCNKFLLKKELIEGNVLLENPDLNTYLYPNLSDANFNIKIATKKEFKDSKYYGTI